MPARALFLGLAFAPSALVARLLSLPQLSAGWDPPSEPLGQLCRPCRASPNLQQIACCYPGLVHLAIFEFAQV